MKTEKRILLAFVLNLAFSVFEFAGGMITGSVAILSDAVHDLGDAAGIGVSYALEKKSKRQPDETYTYGYGRFSVLGSVLTTTLLLLGSAVVFYHAVCRIIDPVAINYNGMILVAVIGVCVNLGAAMATRKGTSLNQKAVSLHMLEDVLGWAVVLVGALVMRVTGLALLDPILSMGVALYIAVHGAHHLKEAMEIFLEKSPCDVGPIQERLRKLEGVLDVHHIHVWSMDEHMVCATVHLVTKDDAVKAIVRQTLKEYGICHVTLETENEHCPKEQCSFGLQL